MFLQRRRTGILCQERCGLSKSNTEDRVITVFCLLPMMYYKKPENFKVTKGVVYKCNHLVYSRCTLYLQNKRGLCVIQQRFDIRAKRTWWSEIDPWLVDDIYKQKGFSDYFKLRSGERVGEVYPTVTVRQIMHSLGMRPLPKELWETVFDRKEI